MKRTPPTKPKKTPEVSVLGYSLLSLLARKDRTGYELSRFTAGARSMIFSSSGHSNIYKELAKLKARGYVSYRIVKEARPFDKKVYSLTKLGRDTLRTWVASPPSMFSSRRELNIRTHALWLLTPNEAIEFLDRQIEIVRTEIEELNAHSRYLQEENDISFPPPPQHPLFGTYSNIVLETDSRKLMIDWCKSIKAQWKRGTRARRALD
jgi:DNA-binding PadR family transcriptional regulator